MRNFFFFILYAVLLISCNENQKTIDNDNRKNDSLAIDSLIDEDEQAIAFEEYDSLFVVIADTGADYFALRSTMFRIHKSTNLPIDTMGRFFNTAKNRIVLPDDDEDEIYAGEYFPRRFPTEGLSLEYLDWYKGKSDENTMALVAGIVNTEAEADSIMRILRPLTGQAFKLKANIYMGCMH